MNPVEVTNKKKKSKNNQASLKLFLDFFFFQSGALLDVAKQNPSNTQLQRRSSLERFFVNSIFNPDTSGGALVDVTKQNPD